MPSVLLIPDRPGWAYDILAQLLKDYLLDWQVDIAYIVDIREDLESIDISDYDVVFFFLWFDAMRYGPKIKGFDFRRTCVGVHSIASWEKRRLNAKYTSLICNQFAATGIISEQLNRLLSLKKPFLTPNGVDENLFTPASAPPIGRLRFMWVGNPSSQHHGDNKGFDSIITPVFNSLGEQVELLTATSDQPVAREDMGAFYAGGHVLLCMSESEGGPLPVIEAMHVGRPVISTSVGIVPEVVNSGVNGWIIDRSRSALKAQILKLVDDSRCLEEMCDAARDAVRDRTGVGMAVTYATMFRSVLEGEGIID